MQTNLPHWARKPQHKKEVVATPLGWMVKETGEYLKLVKNLDQKLQSLGKELQESINAVDEEQREVTDEPIKDNTDDENLVAIGVDSIVVQRSEQVDDEHDAIENDEDTLKSHDSSDQNTKKRRGRPKRNK